MRMRERIATHSILRCQRRSLLLQVHGISYFCILFEDCHPVPLYTSPFGGVAPVATPYHFRLTLLYMLSHLRNIKFLVSDADIVWFRIPHDYLEKVRLVLVQGACCVVGCRDRAIFSNMFEVCLLAFCARKRHVF